MAVDGVNSSNNNTALYTAGGAVLGAGAGAAAGYLTKPFLKDGAPTDSFIKKVDENQMITLQPKERKICEDALAGVEKLKNVTNMEELKNFIKNNELIKEGCKISNNSVEDVLAEIDEKEFEAAKAEVKSNIDSFLNTRKGLIKEAIDSAWDSDKKKFVHDASKITKEGFEAVTKAAKSIQGKYAAIYGAIGAAVLGLGTLLCCGGKKAEEPSQTVDTQV